MTNKQFKLLCKILMGMWWTQIRNKQTKEVMVRQHDWKKLDSEVSKLEDE